MAGLVEAASELESIARHLRRAGEFELVRELTKAMRDAVAPVEDEIRAGLDDYLPKRYAYELNADLRIGTHVRTNERNPGVTITGQAGSFGGTGHAAGRGRKLRYLNDGRLTHPVFGDREVWRTQEEPSVQPGFFTGPAEAAAPRVRAAIERALEDVAAKATSKGAPEWPR